LCADSDSDIGGYKIGLTSPAMQQMCGLSTPVYGCLLRKQIHSSDASIDPARYGRLGIEFEIAVRLGKDVNAVPATWSGMGDYVDAIAPSFELIDDRHAIYTQLDGASLIADNAWSAGAVFGAWQSVPADLPARRGRIYSDGAQVDEGRVGDALEHP